MATWQTHFTERELKEIEFCRLYALNFNHGTDGHNIRNIVAKMVGLLDAGLIAAIPKPHDPTKPADISRKPQVLKD